MRGLIGKTRVNQHKDEFPENLSGRRLTMKKLELGGVICKMSRQECLIVTLKDGNGTYFDVAVGDLPIGQEDIVASIGKRINFKVEAEIQGHPCVRHKHHPKDGPCMKMGQIPQGP